MKKYILATLILFIPCVTYALTMCARDNSLVVALDSGITGDNPAADANDWTWRTDFSYGTLVGEGTCLSEAEGGKPSNTTEISGVMTNVDGEKLPHSIPRGQSGISEANTENPELSTQRAYCWCRMTHPAMSRWVFLYSRSAGDCTSRCVNNCSYYANSNTTWRKAMFNSIGQ